MAETIVTTQNMIAVSVSTRSAQDSSKAPLSIQVKSSVVRALPPSATSKKTMMEKSAASTRPPEVTSCAPRSPRPRPKKPARIAPTSGRNTMATSNTASALHHVDVFDGDGAAVAEIDHQDRQADGRFRGRHGQDEEGKDLANEIIQVGREGHQIDVDRKQHELDRHQDHDDVLTVQEDAQDPQGKEDCGHRQVVSQSDLEHHTPPPLGTSLSSTPSARWRATCLEIDWRRTPSR